MLKKDPVSERPLYYHKEKKVLEDLVDPQMMQRFKKPQSFYEYLPEMINKQRNLDFPFAAFQTAYQPHAPYKYNCFLPHLAYSNPALKYSDLTYVVIVFKLVPHWAMGIFI